MLIDIFMCVCSAEFSDPKGFEVIMFYMLNTAEYAIDPAHT